MVLLSIIFYNSRPLDTRSPSRRKRLSTCKIDEQFTEGTWVKFNLLR